MSLTRRTFCRTGAAAATAVAATIVPGPAVRAAASWTSSPSSRLLVVRNTTVVLELAGRRIVVDPCFAPGLGAPGVLRAPPPAVPPEQLGVVDVVLCTSGLPGAFDEESYGRLDAAAATVLVPDEPTARRVRRAGRSRRVRVAGAGDVLRIGPLVVSISPARAPPGAAAAAVGFHVTGAVDDDGEPGGRGPVGAAAWHTGPIPPLDVDAVVAGFAADHRADVVLGAGPVFGWRSGGPAFLAGIADVQALARRAGARAVVPLGLEVDVAPPLSGVVGRLTDDARPVGLRRDDRADVRLPDRSKDGRTAAVGAPPPLLGSGSPSGLLAARPPVLGLPPGTWLRLSSSPVHRR